MVEVLLINIEVSNKSGCKPEGINGDVRVTNSHFRKVIGFELLTITLSSLGVHMLHFISLPSVRTKVVEVHIVVYHIFVITLSILENALRFTSNCYE